jgi:hypothetical protein
MSVSSYIGRANGIISTKYVSLNKSATHCIYIMMLNRKKSNTRGNILLHYGSGCVTDDCLVKNQHKWKKSYVPLYTHVFVMSNDAKSQEVVVQIKESLAKFHANYIKLGKSKCDNVIDIPAAGVDSFIDIVSKLCKCIEKSNDEFYMISAAEEAEFAKQLLERTSGL